MITTSIFIVIAYLLGSLSSAIIVCKFMHLPDPRTEGSGNPGATNVLRVAGKQAAAITLAGDIIKGLIPVLIARLLGVDGFALGLVAIAAFIGHIFPVFFNFKGGKGVATAAGAILGMSFFLGIAAIVTWLIVALIFRYASLAALVASILTPIYAVFIANPTYFMPLLVITAIVIWRHWSNIDRLRTKTEDKIKF